MKSNDPYDCSIKFNKQETLEAKVERISKKLETLLGVAVKQENKQNGKK